MMAFAFHSALLARQPVKDVLGDAGVAIDPPFPSGRGPASGARP